MARQILKNIHRLIEDAQKEQPINESFVADLNAAIEKVDAENTRPPSQSYKPSSLGCIRNMYFQLTAVIPDSERRNSNLIGICESGSDRHERLQAAISKMKNIGIDCEYIDVANFVKSRGLNDLVIREKNGFETKLYHKSLNMSFMCDGIIRYKKQYFILEIKTESVYKWQGRRGVADEHKAQGTAYSVCLGLDKVMFLYENRDNCDKKAYVLEITTEMKEALISKIAECDKYVSALTPPPIPLDIQKRDCNYCRYKTECRRLGG